MRMYTSLTVTRRVRRVSDAVESPWQRLPLKPNAVEITVVRRPVPTGTQIVYETVRALTVRTNVKRDVTETRGD